MKSPAPQTPHARHLILAGGGHSHALALKMLGMNPLDGVRITLVSDVSHAPYSGMVPGHIAGFYSWEETHIDLRKMCQYAGAAFVHARVSGLDLPNRRLLVEGRPPLTYDALSLNIGSTPAMQNVPGAREFTTPAKPVSTFLSKWEKIVRDAQSGISPSPTIVIVGGGAGGVELALGMHQRLNRAGRITLVHRGKQILDTHNAAVRKIMTDALASRGIKVLTGTTVDKITENSVHCAGGDTLPADHIFWVTSASPPPWIKDCGLSTDDSGFVLVDSTLQSLSNPEIFATGDIATIHCDARPKSGVFAVRMARPLLENLRRFLHAEPLLNFRPQKNFLSLVGTADGSAVASRKRLAWMSPLMWKWKDHIDRKFMRKFSDLPAMKTAPVTSTPPAADPAALTNVLSRLRHRSLMRCLGCAAKVGSSVLSKVMSRLREQFPDVLSPAPAEGVIHTGLDVPDDAAIFSIPAHLQLVQTVDYLPALVADPHLFGRIAALHCFSDIFAMGAKPHSALAALLVPFQSESLAEELLFQMLSGICQEMRAFGAVLLGGHTAEAEPLAATLTCNGLIPADTAMHKAGLEPGQSLILTKALGVGALFAGEMRLRSRGNWIDSAISSMLMANFRAAQILRQHGARACTDVTGFGLAGHLAEMLRPSQAAAVLQLNAIPLLPGALETSQQGLLSSLHDSNSAALHLIANARDFTSNGTLPLLFDPQTSGGLLAGVPSAQAQDCIAALQAEGYLAASTIGHVTDQENPDTLITLA